MNINNRITRLKQLALSRIGTRIGQTLRAMPNDAKSLTPRQPARGNGETILIIEDEADVRKVLRLLLEARGFKVLVAESGIEGLIIFKHNHEIIRVTITDMRMKGMQGPEVVRELRIINVHARIIVVSGFRDGHWEIPEEQGRLIFLPKPTSGPELAAAVQSLLN